MCTGIEMNDECNAAPWWLLDAGGRFFIVPSFFLPARRRVASPLFFALFVAFVCFLLCGLLCSKMRNRRGGRRGERLSDNYFEIDN